MIRYFVIGLVLFLTACGSDVVGLRQAVPYQDPELRTLWNEVEACSGLRGDFDGVRFYIAPDGIKRNGVWVNALWVEDGNKIFLTPPFMHDPRTIKHEEMHALLQRSGHPAEYFHGVCGELGD